MTGYCFSQALDLRMCTSSTTRTSKRPVCSHNSRLTGVVSRQLRKSSLPEISRTENVSAGAERLLRVGRLSQTHCHHEGARSVSLADFWCDRPWTRCADDLDPNSKNRLRAPS